MPAQSKEECKTDDQQKEAKLKQLDLLAKHMFMNVVTLTLNVQADPLLYGTLCEGDLAAVARFISGCTAAGSAIEFLVNPTIGSWSDANGRRGPLIIGPLVNSVLPGMLAVLQPTLPLAAFVRVLGGVANSLSGTPATMAAIVDIAQGDRSLLTAAQIKLGGLAGLAVIVGPFIGAVTLARTGNPAAVYALKAAWSFLHFLWLRSNHEETLTDDKKKHFDGSFQSPFNFVDLFTRTRMLRQVTIFNLLQCFAEGKCLNDLNQIWMKGVLNWDVQTTARWTIGYGVMMVLNGILSKQLVGKIVQPRTFVSVSSYFGILAMAIKGGIHDGRAYTLGLLANSPCVNAMGGAPIKAEGALKAVQAGLGNAEYTTKFANLRSIIYVIGPQMYLRIFASQIAAKRNPGVAYFLCAVIAFAIPELFLHRQWKDEDLG